MSGATPSRRVTGQRATRAAETVVQRHGGRQGGEAHRHANEQVVKSASAVALEGEDVLGSPVDRLDPLADRRQVGPVAALVLAARTDDSRFELGEVGFEALAAEVLVADQDQRLARLALAARDEPQADLLLVELRAGQRQRPGRAIEREQGMQPKAPEEAAM